MTNNEIKKQILTNQQVLLRNYASEIRRQKIYLERHQKLYDEAVELYNEAKTIKQYILEDKI